MKYEINCKTSDHCDVKNIVIGVKDGISPREVAGAVHSTLCTVFCTGENIETTELPDTDDRRPIN